MWKYLGYLIVLLLIWLVVESYLWYETLVTIRDMSDTPDAEIPIMKILAMGAMGMRIRVHDTIGI